VGETCTYVEIDQTVLNTRDLEDLIDYNLRTPILLIQLLIVLTLWLTLREMARDTWLMGSILTTCVGCERCRLIRYGK
jgi:hypothetical protein